MLHEETGEIVRVAPNRAWVRVLATSACGSCATSCGMTEEGYRLVEVVDPIGAQPQQEVGLQLPGQRLVAAAFVMYGIPVLLFLCGLLAGHSIATRFGLPVDGVAGGAAFGMLALGFVGLHRARHYFERRETFYPVITRIIASAAERHAVSTAPRTPFSV